MFVTIMLGVWGVFGVVFVAHNVQCDDAPGTAFTTAITIATWAAFFQSF